MSKPSARTVRALAARPSFAAQITSALAVDYFDGQWTVTFGTASAARDFNGKARGDRFGEIVYVADDQIARRF
jgi:hypothetical protein